MKEIASNLKKDKMTFEEFYRLLKNRLKNVTEAKDAAEAKVNLIHSSENEQIFNQKLAIYESWKDFVSTIEALNE